MKVLEHDRFEKNRETKVYSAERSSIYPWFWKLTTKTYVQLTPDRNKSVSKWCSKFAVSCASNCTKNQAYYMQIFFNWWVPRTNLIILARGSKENYMCIICALSNQNKLMKALAKSFSTNQFFLDSYYWKSNHGKHKILKIYPFLKILTILSQCYY